MNGDHVMQSKAVAVYRAEVLRWNKQINLISRLDSAGRLDILLRQSAGGLGLVWDKLLADRVVQASRTPGTLSEDPLWYFDLGSGAGLPGFVWHIVLTGRLPGVRTWLVEPRDKRAWFLSRLAGVCGTAPLEVVADRWGEAGRFIGSTSATSSTGATLPPLVVISLKALKLDDGKVLRGLLASMPENVRNPSSNDRKSLIVIARYYPAGQKLDDELQRTLGISPIQSSLQINNLTMTSVDRGVLGAPAAIAAGASIVYSCYSA